MRIYRNSTPTGQAAERTPFIHTVSSWVPRCWRVLNPHEARKPGAWKEARRAKVERARRLIEDVTYPPRQVLQAVAENLARNINFWRLLPFLQL